MKELDAMAEMLVRRGVVSEADRGRALAALGAVWSDRVAFVWTTRQVMGLCPRLDEAECKAVLGAVLMEHDREVGVNYDVVVFTAARLFGERALEDDDEDG